MKFIKTLLPLSFTFLLGCKTEPTSENLNGKLEEKSVTKLDSIKENLEIEKKIDEDNHHLEKQIPKLDSRLKKKNSPDSIKKFVLHLPDTTKLYQQEERIQWSESIAYLYLINNYKKKTDKDSIEYMASEDDKKSICRFKQEFKPGIKYYTWHCKDSGGIEEVIEFPKIENDEMKNFIELLFYDRWNTWTSEFKYEPDGVGCYYEIKQEPNKTILEIWCGC